MLGTKVVVKASDQINFNDIESLKPERIIISPGPGKPSDAGNSCTIIEAFAERLPILGVCLGHQCIGAVFGANVQPAKRILHGKTSLIHHNQTDLFADLPTPFQAARYHSLAIDAVPDSFEKSAWTNDGEIMAIRHKSKPLFGVQFHPESFFTPMGSSLLENFLHAH